MRRDTLLRSLQRLFSTSLVNLIHVLSSISQHDDLIATYLHESAMNDVVVLLAIYAVAKFAWRQGGHDRRVVRQDAKFALAAGCDDHIYVTLEEDALSRNYFKPCRHRLRTNLSVGLLALAVPGEHLVDGPHHVKVLGCNMVVLAL